MRAGRTVGGLPAAGGAHRPAGLAELPDEPGIYIVRNAAGQPLYVGKSVAIRARARAHFQPSAPPEAWTAQAASVEARVCGSELGALVLECREIKRLRPPGNVRLKHDDPYVFLRCRLDIPFPVLEIAREPASGHAVTIGPLQGHRAATELMEQLNSLFGLRHCGRALPRREHPSAYGQMGRCLSPCLQDLDPNLYRRPAGRGPRVVRARRPTHPRRRCRAARARRDGDGGGRGCSALRAGRLAAASPRAAEGAVPSPVGGHRDATGHPCASVADHRAAPAGAAPGDAFWLVGGRLVDWCRATSEAELERRSAAALARAAGRVAAHVPAEEVDELRIVATWLASHEHEVRELDALATA
ncbi:hypothetical protein LRS13_14295 [Svornostia abyssi]|uniref:GIY-YIG domain-containing protein n=1 Tax=Svornostia abyssi TaxID=2898438 RepID=A0ABY5PB44_9ACTN|nr:hypothetical protein LRS13_14295 [Parviterribacteraceae bacterium J379]